MATRRIDVQVKHGGIDVRIEHSRPIRITPQGTAGITVDGAVFNLHETNYIDLSETAWEISECQRFLVSDREIPYFSSASNLAVRFEGYSGHWDLEATNHGFYFLFNASPHSAARLVDRIQGGGITVQRWDASHKVASSGERFDWFARLTGVGSEAELRKHITNLLSPQEEPANADFSSQALENADLELLLTQLEKLAAQNEELHSSSADAYRRLHSVQTLLNQSTARELDLSRALNRSLVQQESLHKQIVALESGLLKSDFIDEFDQNQELLTEALNENSQLLSRVRELEEENARLLRTLEEEIDENARLTDDLSDIYAMEKSRNRAVTRLAPAFGAEGLLTAALPNLIFVADSVDVLLGFEKPAAALKYLLDISNGVAQGTAITQANGWRESTHLSTGVRGKEDMGRIYFSKRDSDYLVSVHLKLDDKDQKQHFRRLTHFK